MSAQHQLELVYRDLRSLRQKVLDLEMRVSQAHHDY
jgi:hypothetical protein